MWKSSLHIPGRCWPTWSYMIYMFSRRQQPEFCGWIAHSHLRQTRRLPEVCWPLPWAHLASRHWQHLTTSNNSNLWLTTLILHAFLAFLDLLDLTLKIRSEKNLLFSFWSLLRFTVEGTSSEALSTSSLGTYMQRETKVSLSNHQL